MLHIKEMHIFKTSNCTLSILPIAIWEREGSIKEILHVTKLDFVHFSRKKKSSGYSFFCKFTTTAIALPR